MAFDPNDDLQRAIALIQAGRPDEARPLLEAIVAADPERELAWLWLATVSTDRAERIRFLQRVLTINPANETARAAYARLTGQQPPAPPAAPPPATAAETAPRGVRPTALLIVLAVAAIAVTAVLVAIYVRDQASGDDEPAAPPTLAAQETLTPTSDVSATPSNTPAPSVTPGPSPTSVWDSAVPTWTPEPSDTPAPTQRIATWTPRPPTETPSPIPTERPPTDTAEPDVTAAQTPTGEPAGDEDDTVTGED